MATIFLVVRNFFFSAVNITFYVFNLLLLLYFRIDWSILLCSADAMICGCVYFWKLYRVSILAARIEHTSYSFCVWTDSTFSKINEPHWHTVVNGFRGILCSTEIQANKSNTQNGEIE